MRIGIIGQVDLGEFMSGVKRSFRNEMAVIDLHCEQILFVAHLDTGFSDDFLEPLRRELRQVFTYEVMVFRNIRSGQTGEVTDITVVFHRLVGPEGLRNARAFLKGTARKLRRAVRRVLKRKRFDQSGLIAPMRSKETSGVASGSHSDPDGQKGVCPVCRSIRRVERNSRTLFYARESEPLMVEDYVMADHTHYSHFHGVDQCCAGRGMMPQSLV